LDTASKHVEAVSRYLMVNLHFEEAQLDEFWSFVKKLRRQNQLDESCFELGQVSGRVAPEAALTDPSVLAPVQRDTQCAPGVQVTLRQVIGAERASALACGHGSDQASTTTHDQRSSGALATTRATFMISERAKDMLQVIVRAGEVFNVIAVEQTRPVTAGYLEEVIHGRRQGTRA